VNIFLPLLLLVAGVLALFLEAFIPSGGVITLVGLASVVGGVIVAFLRGGTTVGVVFLGASIVTVPLALVGAFTLLRRSALGRRLTLQDKQSAESGYVAQDASDHKLIGKQGVALSALHPSGEARIGDEKYDVITEGEMVEKGADIEVRSVGGNRIVVRRVRPEAKSS